MGWPHALRCGVEESIRYISQSELSPPKEIVDPRWVLMPSAHIPEHICALFTERSARLPLSLAWAPGDQ